MPICVVIEFRMNLMNIKTPFILLALFLVSLSGWSAEESTVAPIAKIKRVDVDEFDKLRANTNNILLDVRSVYEFEKGRIPGAINIDINSSKFAEKISALDKNKTYLVNCAVGMRSAKACKKMEAMGFKELYDLESGFDGWKKARKPIEK